MAKTGVKGVAPIISILTGTGLSQQGFSNPTLANIGVAGSFRQHHCLLIWQSSSILSGLMQQQCYRHCGKYVQFGRTWCRQTFIIITHIFIGLVKHHTHLQSISEG